MLISEIAGGAVTNSRLPLVIQGGMGAGVSDWRLARAVAEVGQLGVVAGTALDVILVRRLQLGDPAGHMRRALARLPLPGVAERIVERYFIEGGKPHDAPFRGLPLLSTPTDRARTELLVAANFVEIFLAREGHDGAVGVNYLEKIQLPTLASLYGAMLAGVSWVLMGAGVPRQIPAVLAGLAEHRPVQLTLDVAGTPPACDEAATVQFDPRSLWEGEPSAVERPRFVGIVASNTAATFLARRIEGVDGLVVEGSMAGGHNAPPRGRVRLDARGQPIFGERDRVDLAAVARLGLPFWVAGASASPERLEAVRDERAAGVQIGTAFAFCRESGIESTLKRRVNRMIASNSAVVVTDARASPTGFPFKILRAEGTLSETETFEARTRVCDLGYLRHAYWQPSGRIGWRCPGEPTRTYLRKGGAPEDVPGRKCICNGLLANLGLAQVRRDGEHERPLLTSGSELSVVRHLLERGGGSYGAADVVDHVLGSEAASGPESTRLGRAPARNAEKARPYAVGDEPRGVAAQTDPPNRSS